MQTETEDAGSDWKRPDQLMKLHKFRLRKNALTARFNQSSTETKNTRSNSSPTKKLANQTLPASRKRKNPFLKNHQNKKHKDCSTPEVEIDSADSTFELLNFASASTKINNTEKINEIVDSCLGEQNPSVEQVTDEEPKGKKHIPIDWTLKTKLRLMSTKPFAWKGKLKASEEASGTTAYVRCLDIGEQETTLDTSPNARFHQCCLVWQHPSLPWMEMFPRSQARLNVSNHNNVSITQTMKEALYKDWCSSFRSLFHLLRVRQCPYFYMCGNSFTVLFRAAGICGISEVQALVTPTTRGLRESLKNEEIQFTMPLRKKKRMQSEAADPNDDDEHNDQWLKSVGIEESEIRRIGFSQVKVQSGREAEGDNWNESLVFVTGVEAQALFNFLLNCKAIMTQSGPYGGIPPTLLSPIAFHGATLRPLKVRESVVSNGIDKFHSLEITGPILPDILPSLCTLMNCDHIDKYSVSCALLLNTRAFTMAKHGTEEQNDPKSEKLAPNIFGLENLTDCGFNKGTLSHFCSPDPDRLENFESITFEHKLYTWT